MRDWKSQAHVKWECKYHVVIVPKYRKKVLYGKARKQVGHILKQLCRQKGVELVEGHAMPDHVHMILSVPPKFSLSMVVGYLKGKSAIHIHREINRTKQGFTGKHFWSRGYCVSTVGLDEKMIRAYVRNQEKLDCQAEGQGTLNFN
ncbi:MAG: IS200/IS605 family transposase [Magnetococcales bacterium]|nr:IS200/IS605 family transposase [Magnetococcales bacterium]